MGPFTVDDDCATLTDGQSCSIEIRFLPTEPGSTGGELVVESSIEPITAALGGTGNAAVHHRADPHDGPPDHGRPDGRAADERASDERATDRRAEHDGDRLPTTSSPVETRDECDAVRSKRRSATTGPRDDGRRVGVDRRQRLDRRWRAGSVRRRAVHRRRPTGAAMSGSRPPASVATTSRPIRRTGRRRRSTARTRSPGGGSSRRRVVGEGLFLILEVQGMRFDADVGGFVPAGDSFNEEARISVDSRPRGFVSQRQRCGLRSRHPPARGVRRRRRSRRPAPVGAAAPQQRRGRQHGRPPTHLTIRSRCRSGERSSAERDAKTVTTSWTNASFSKMGFTT